MKEIKKILDVMAVLEKGRVSLALFMLRDEADNGWDMIQTTQDVAPFMLHTYSEVVARALIIEREMEEAQRLRSKNSRFDGSEKWEQDFKR
ncbi:hypothetical protein CK203_066444 [Vitis vinifera]|uniref:Uncharacterized protein n=1 Tax=Vitis vinifera TaxID=29760 RepID=A0A438FQH8_VITVI|nr:hypothetical protein CK203_066444 [Vitis vinifera]